MQPRYITLWWFNSLYYWQSEVFMIMCFRTLILKLMIAEDLNLALYHWQSRSWRGFFSFIPVLFWFPEPDGCSVRTPTNLQPTLLVVTWTKHTNAAVRCSHGYNLFILLEDFKLNVLSLNLSLEIIRWLNIVGAPGLTFVLFYPRG